MMRTLTLSSLVLIAVAAVSFGLAGCSSEKMTTETMSTATATGMDGMSDGKMMNGNGMLSDGKMMHKGG